MYLAVIGFVQDAIRVGDQTEVVIVCKTGELMGLLELL